MYHWNAMMSPIEAVAVMLRYPPYQVMTTFTLEMSSPHPVQRNSSRRWANSSLRRTVCRPRM